MSNKLHAGHPCDKKTMCEREMSAHIEKMMSQQDDYVLMLQKIFDDKGYCGHDFMTILLNFCIQFTARVIRHVSEDMDDKKKAFHEFSTALATELGGKPVTLEHILAQIQKNNGATVN